MRTREWLGLQPEPEPWCGRLYQTANRLAHLYFMREVAGVRAWFVHLLFLDEPHGPTNLDQWGEATRSVDTELGLRGRVPGAGHVLLPAGAYEELVDATTTN